MRKALASALIRLSRVSYRLSCRIYPARVTEIHINCLDPDSAAEAVQRVMARRESRGWN